MAFLQNSSPFQDGKIELGGNQVKTLVLFLLIFQALNTSFDLTRKKFGFQQKWLPDMDSNHD